VAPTASAVSHLLLVDNSLLFFRTSSEGAAEVKDILRKYRHASGQSINMDKSSIIFNKGCLEAIRECMKSGVGGSKGDFG
jgi:hypothetical protein